jgi:predicted transposase/invertase (TIGR01784 family)
LKYNIDAMVDCVFKAILGSRGNEPVLIDFLNAILRLPKAITEVEIANPYNEKAFVGDKCAIVDIKAFDKDGRCYQVEVQTSIPSYLHHRVLYMWADLYADQLKEGDEYNTLKPVMSIWLIRGHCIPYSKPYHHRFVPYDPIHQVQLSEHQVIHLLEVDKWHKIRVETDEDRWLKFFKESKEIESNHIPQEFQTEVMQKAIGTLRQFSEKERARHLYKRQLDFARIVLTEEKSKKRLEEQLATEHAARLAEQKARQTEKSARIKAEKVAAIAEKQLEKAQAEKEKAQAEKERAQAEKERAQAEKERAQAERIKAQTERAKEQAEKEKALKELERLRARLEAQAVKRPRAKKGK